MFIGLGDILNTRAILDGAVRDGYIDAHDKIVISPSEKNLKYDDNQIAQWHSPHRGSQWVGFIKNLCRIIFHDERYELSSCGEGQELTVFQPIYKLYAPRFIDELCVGDPKLPGREFVTVSTKARAFRGLTNPQQARIGKMFRALAEKYDIILIGENNDTFASCFRGQKDSSGKTTLLYDFLIGVIPPQSLVDMTISPHRTWDSGAMVSETTAQLQHDCVIMNKAKLNVCFGIGGNVILAATVGSVACFQHRHAKITPVYHAQYDGLEYISLAHDEDTFINAVSRMCHV
jgi:hypothetical protein